MMIQRYETGEGKVKEQSIGEKTEDQVMPLCMLSDDELTTTMTHPKT